jgi:epoxyqueuosine reductase
MREKISMKIVSEFYKALKKRGCQGKIVSAIHLPELLQDIKKHQKSKALDPKFYEEYKSFFDFKAEVDFKIMSLFIISDPQPSYQVKFEWEDKEVTLLIPPTYLFGRKVIDDLTKLVSDILNPRGYHATYAMLPQKTLAVRSGLAEYGRNNITYVPGMGSFHRLTTLYTNFPAEEDNWQELRMMKACENCQACKNRCPTDAIPSDRFLLRAERCLSFHNEHPGDISFPDWIDKNGHNCLVGCFHCQKACPVNKKVINWTKQGPSFSKEETSMILERIPFKRLPEITREKFEKFDLIEYYDIMQRNIGVILK